MTFVRDVLKDLVPINMIFAKFCPDRWRDTPYSYSVRCPFHSDTQPSFRINQKSNLFRCYGACQRAWDVVEFVAEMTPSSRTDAESLIFRTMNMDGSYLMRMQRLSQLIGSPEPFVTYRISRSLEQDGEQYLQGRGISKETWTKYKVKQLNKHIVFPAFSEGVITSLTLRDMEASGNGPKYVVQNGTMRPGMFGFDTGEGKRLGSSVILVEGPMDVLSFAQMGLHAVAVKLRPDAVQLVWLRDYYRVGLCMDADEAGMGAAGRYMKDFGGFVLLTPVVLPSGKDPNDLLQSGELLNWITQTAPWALEECKFYDTIGV